MTDIIRADEQVILFPTVGRWNLNANAAANNTTTTTNSLEVPVHGWIFEPEANSIRRKAFRALLRQTLRAFINNDDHDDAVLLQNEILNRRISPFLVDNERWKTPRIFVWR